jgi:hypothetical protein
MEHATDSLRHVILKDIARDLAVIGDAPTEVMANAYADTLIAKIHTICKQLEPLRPRPTITTPAGDAKLQLQALAEQLRAERPELSQTQAMRLAIGTPDGEALFRTLRGSDGWLRAAGIEIDTTTNEPAPPAEEDAMERELTKVLKNAAPDARAADVIDAQIEAVAAEIRKNAPSLTDAQAYTRALEQRPDLYTQYRAVDGRTVAEVREHEAVLTRRRGAGFETWGEGFDRCIKWVADRDRIPYGDAFEVAKREFPDAHAAYEREARGAA